MGDGIQLHGITISYGLDALDTGKSKHKALSTINDSSSETQTKPASPTSSYSEDTFQIAWAPAPPLAAPSIYALMRKDSPYRESSGYISPAPLEDYTYSINEGLVTFWMTEQRRNQFTDSEIWELTNDITYFSYLAGSNRPVDTIVFDGEEVCTFRYACYYGDVSLPAEERSFAKLKSTLVHELGHDVDSKKGIQYNQEWLNLIQDFFDIHEHLYEHGNKGKAYYQNLVFGRNYGLNKVHTQIIIKDGKRIEISEEIDRKKEIFANLVEDFYTRPDQLASNLWQLSQEDIGPHYRDSIKKLWYFMEQEVFQGVRFTTRALDPFDAYALLEDLTTHDINRNNNMVRQWFLSHPPQERLAALNSYWNKASDENKAFIIRNFYYFWNQNELDSSLLTEALLQLVGIEGIIENPNLKEWFLSRPSEEKLKALRKYGKVADEEDKKVLIENFSDLWNQTELETALPTEALLQIMDAGEGTNNIESSLEQMDEETQLAFIQSLQSLHRKRRDISYEGRASRHYGEASQKLPSTFGPLYRLAQSPNTKVAEAAEVLLLRVLSSNDLLELLLGEKIGNEYKTINKYGYGLINPVSDYEDFIHSISDWERNSIDSDQKLWALDYIEKYRPTTLDDRVEIRFEFGARVFEDNYALDKALAALILFDPDTRVRQRAVEVLVRKGYYYMLIPFLKNARWEERLKFKQKDREVISAIREGIIEYRNPRRAQRIRNRRAKREAGENNEMMIAEK